MIRTFANKATKDFYEGKPVRRFRSLDAGLAIKRLDIINAATRLADIPALKSVNLHPLKGDRQGQWAISVNDPWRICFEFRDGDAYNGGDR